ncbi:MAG: class I tRNA ligase family protein, partial [Angelakisella sp.]
EEEGYSPELESGFHKMIKKVTDDIESLKFNTAIAAMMGMLNDIYAKGSVTKGELRTLIILLDPFAPHIAEEMNELLGGDVMITDQTWPISDPAKCVDSTVEIVIQISGKIKARMMIDADYSKEQVASEAMALPAVAEAISGKTIVKEIYVPGKLYNIVVK